MPLGVGMRVFNVEYDGHLRDELHVHYVPSIFAVIDGQARYYRGSDISPTTIRHFLRDAFPSGLYTEVDASVLDPKFIFPFLSWLRAPVHLKTLVFTETVFYPFVGFVVTYVISHELNMDSA